MASIDTGTLTGDKRSASAALQEVFDRYGLGTLAPKINEMIQNGYNADLVNILLQDTPEYKERFKANDARIKAGLPALNPEQYLATEESYRQVMSAAGLPLGFYDTPSDFTKWIADDVSSTEIQQRVQVASKLVNSVDANTKAAFSKWYSHGDMVAYALDRDRAEPLLEKQLAAAQAAGAATGQGVNINQSTAEKLADNGITADQARAGFGMVAQGNARAGTLDAIYGDTLNQDDLINEALLDNGQAALKRGRLASKERAAFSGTSGSSAASLSRSDAGRI